MRDEMVNRFTTMQENRSPEPDDLYYLSIIDFAITYTGYTSGIYIRAA
jgi:hypothetical protein